MRNPNYIEPPAACDVPWFSGPPPEIGWWPASTGNMAAYLRWWNGKCWSTPLWHDQNPGQLGHFNMAEHAASKADTPENNARIRWTHRWWLNPAPPPPPPPKKFPQMRVAKVQRDPAVVSGLRTRPDMAPFESIIACSQKDIEMWEYNATRRGLVWITEWEPFQ